MKNNVTITIDPREEMLHKTTRVLLFGRDISAFPKTVQFFIASFGVFFFYIIYGYIQELMFRFEGFKPHGWYLTWFQFSIYVVLATMELRVVGGSSSKESVPLPSFIVLSVLTVATMGLSNTSLGYLNYPTQVIFKSCKLIPTMIGGVFIQGKRYNTLDLTAVLSMSFGLAMFTLADSTVHPNFNSYGVLLISLALCADGAIGNVQEKVMKSLGVTSVEIVQYSYGIGFILIGCGLIITGQCYPSFIFFFNHPIRTYGYGFLFSLTGYIGVQFVLALVRIFGALPAVTVTTCRKSVTIILSFLAFTKPFTFQYVWSGMLVVFGIYLSLYSKNRDQWNAKFKTVVHHMFGSGRRLDAMHPGDVV